MQPAPMVGTSQVQSPIVSVQDTLTLLEAMWNRVSTKFKGKILGDSSALSKEVDLDINESWKNFSFPLPSLEDLKLCGVNAIALLECYIKMKMLFQALSANKKPSLQLKASNEHLEGIAKAFSEIACSDRQEECKTVVKSILDWKSFKKFVRQQDLAAKATTETNTFEVTSLQKLGPKHWISDDEYRKFLEKRGTTAREWARRSCEDPDSLWASGDSFFIQGDIIVIDELTEENQEALLNFCQDLREKLQSKSKLFRIDSLQEQYEHLSESKKKYFNALAITCIPFVGINWLLTPNNNVEVTEIHKKVLECKHLHALGNLSTLQRCKPGGTNYDFICHQQESNYLAIAVLNETEAQKVADSQGICDEATPQSNRVFSVQVVINNQNPYGDKQEEYCEVSLPFPAAQVARVSLSELLNEIVEIERVASISVSSGDNEIQFLQPPNELELADKSTVTVTVQKDAPFGISNQTQEVELPLSKPEIDSKKLCSPKQKEVAIRLFLRTLQILSGDNPQMSLQDQIKIMQAQFHSFKFLVLTPNLNSIMEQTLERVKDWEFQSKHVVYKYFRSDNCYQPRYKECWDLIEEAKDEKNKQTLFIFIVDECHFANNPGGAQDEMINDPKLTERDNVFMLLVSATPWNVLSMYSRIREIRAYKSDPTHRIEITKRYTVTQSDNSVKRVCDLHDVPNPHLKKTEDYETFEEQLLPGESNVIEWWDWNTNDPAQQGTGRKYVSLNDLFRSITTEEKSKRYIRQDDLMDRMIDSFNNNKYSSRDKYHEHKHHAVEVEFGADCSEDMRLKEDGFWKDELLLVDYIFSFLYFHIVRRRDYSQVSLSPICTPPEKRRSIEPPSVKQILESKLAHEKDLHDAPAPILNPDHEVFVPDSNPLKDPNDCVVGYTDGELFLQEFWNIINTMNAKWSKNNTMRGTNLQIVADFYLRWIADIMDEDGPNLLSWTETDQIVCSVLSSRKVQPKSASSETKIRGFMNIVRVVQTKTGVMWHNCLSYLCKHYRWQKYFDVIDDFGRTGLQLKLSPFWSKAYEPNFSSTVSYEDLLHLPCIIILVAKGRMGDTFPHSLRAIDLRLRHMNEGSRLSTIVQELGRLCRYVTPDDLRPYALISKPLYKEMYNAIVETTGKKRTHSVVHDGRGIEYAQKTIKLDHNMYQIAGFLSKAKLSAALQFNEDISGSEGPSRIRKSFYRSMYGPLPSQKEIRAGKSVSSYDRDNTEHITQKNRILLSAETQIGKTGAYLCFLKHIEAIFSEQSPALKSLISVILPVGRAPVSEEEWSNIEWNNPDWEQLEKSRFSRYSNVRCAKYHPRVQQFRLKLLLEAVSYSKPLPTASSSFSSSNDDTTCMKKYLDSVQYEEMISCHEGQNLLKCLDTENAASPVALHSVPNRMSNEFSFNINDRKRLQELISWDQRHVLNFDIPQNNKFEASPQWNFSNTDHNDSFFDPFGDRSLTNNIWGETGPSSDVRKECQASVFEEISDYSTEISEQGVMTAAVANQNIPPKPYNADKFSILRLLNSPSILPRTEAFLCPISKEPECIELFGKQSIRVSIPDKLVQYFDLENQEGWNKLRSFRWDFRMRCIFIPSYNRSKAANLYLNEIFKDDPSLVVEFVVVRPGPEFESYYNEWSTADNIVFVQLPEQIDIRYLQKALDQENLNNSKGCRWMDNFDLSGNIQYEHHHSWHKRNPVIIPEDGIGYARLAIQLFSHFMGIEQIWMLDDNITEFHQLIVEQKTPSKDTQPRLCSMLEPMKFIERIFREAGDWQGKIGILGIRRYWSNYMLVSRPFDKTHMTYSFLYVNIAATMKRRVLYPPKEVWEDIEFAHMCNDSELLVVRSNLYFHDKQNLTRPMSSAVYIHPWQTGEMYCPQSVDDPDMQPAHFDCVRRWCEQNKITMSDSLDNPILKDSQDVLLFSKNQSKKLGIQLPALLEMREKLLENNPEHSEMRVHILVQPLGTSNSHSDITSSMKTMYNLECQEILSTRHDAMTNTDYYIIIKFNSKIEQPLPPPARQSQCDSPVPGSKRSRSFNSDSPPRKKSKSLSSSSIDIAAQSPSPPSNGNPGPSDLSRPNTIGQIRLFPISTLLNQPPPTRSKLPTVFSSSEIAHQSPSPPSNGNPGPSDLSRVNTIDPSKPLPIPAEIFGDFDERQIPATLKKVSTTTSKCRISFRDVESSPNGADLFDTLRTNYPNVAFPSELKDPWTKWYVRLSDGSKVFLENWRGDDAPGFLQKGAVVKVRPKRQNNKPLSSNEMTD